MAILGQNNILTTAASLVSGINAVRFQAGADGVITSINFYITSVATPGNIRCAIYADNSGVPGVLIAESAEIAVSTTGWKNGALSASVVNGTFYHLAFRADSSIIAEYVRDAGVTDQLSNDNSSSAYPTWDDPMGGVTQFSLEVSMYSEIETPVTQQIILMGDGLT